MIAAFAFGPTLAQVGMQFDPGNDAFERTWSRTDLPVREGVADRTWMWGDGAFTEVMQEEYAESPGGMRDVQYFDKSRMEINDPDATDDGLWYVTNGLLVVEMVDGRMQVGDEEFEDREAANQPIAGDPGAAYGPTYADINDLGLRGQPAVNEGEVLTQTITEEGDIVEDESFAEYNAVAGQRVSVPGIDHTVAQPFWDFMNSSGTVYENGEYVVDDLFLNAYYATGYPITEAYWATVPVGGTDRDVLWQCFERRCMTFTPGNPDGFLVEAGNVGQHYYNWRYEDEPEPEPEPETTNYDVLFGSLNGSGVDATGSMTLEGDQLTVMIDASGLTPEENHMQHIHGVDVEMSVCPTPDLDVDENGIISFEEGFPAYGGVAVPLFEDAEGEFYPAADADGNVSFEQTFTVEEGLDLEAHTIIIHGMTVDAGDDETEYDASLPVACGQIYEEGNVPEASEFTYDLDEMNDSGASATADLSLTGQVLTVNIEASGLEAGALHPQHIHGLEGEMATCPVPEEADTNEDGFVEFAEGAPYYGGVVVNLAPYPTAEEDGTESFSLSYIVDDETIALDDRVMVIHGMTADIEGDDIDEESYLASLPVACGGVETDDPDPDPETNEYQVLFGELNGSDVSGSGSLTLADGSLNVLISTAGMTPDEMHMQHIHGVDVDMAVCPGPELDVNEDGIVDIGEGGPAYGGVAVPLFEDIEAEEYPVADESGNVIFNNDFEFDGSAEDLTNHVIVLHGAPVGEEYDATVPVACGLIVPVEAQTYVASDLAGENEAPETVESEGSGEAWFWHDHEAENDVVYYMLTVNDLDDVTAAHIHEGMEGEAGGVVVGLFTPDEGSFPVDGILASGRITADDLSGDLEGMTIDDLVALFGSGETESNAYVNVHTETNPGGEIRDQVIGVTPEIE